MLWGLGEYGECVFINFKYTDLLRKTWQDIDVKIVASEQKAAEMENAPTVTERDWKKSRVPKNFLMRLTDNSKIWKNKKKL
jgi:hypothetical protein